MMTTKEEVLNHVLSKVKVVRKAGDIYHCICPSHQDDKPSLHISMGTAKIVMDCKAGCRYSDILESIGMRPEQLYYDYYERHDSNKPDWRKYVESREKKRIEAIYNYTTIDGKYAFTKLRLEGKKILYGMLKEGLFKYGIPRDTPRKSFKAVYGDIKTIKQAIADNRTIFIPEGEKDVDTLTKLGYVAFSYGGVNDWQHELSELVIDANVVILADNDEAGKKVAERIQEDIKNGVKSVKIVVPMPDMPKADITDYFEAGHTKEEFEQMVKQEQNAVIQDRESNTIFANKGLSVDEVAELLAYKVDYDKEGNIKSKKVMQTVRNFEIIMQNDCRIAGRLRFNEFSRQDYLVGSVPWDLRGNYRTWNSHDDSALYSLLQSEYGMNNRNDYFDAIKNVCAKAKFHPIKDILDTLKWDGKEHIRGLLPDYLGVEDSEYSYQVMKLFMLGAVSRIYQPGCKFDYTMILQGKQGLGKSSFLQMLALSDEWFNDSLDSLDSDKSAQSLMGSWIIELAELKSLARTAGGVDSVKRFLSATQDKYRVPYERRADIFLRQCVFAGTTNKSDFLQDETGNRRFLIIQTGVNKPTKNLFNVASMDDIRAAWAQAVHIYKTENPKLVLPESFKEEAERLQAESMSDDGKIGIIEAYLSNKQRTCAIEVWNEALGEQGRPQKWQATEINAIINNLTEWERMKYPYKFDKYGNQRGFQKKQVYDCSKAETEKFGEFSKIDDVDREQLPFD